MFQSVRQSRHSQHAAAEVNMAPLIDMVFILLIFFLVTAQFTRDMGIQVDKPQAVTGAPLNSESMRIAISPSGAIFVSGETLDLIQLRDKVHQFVVAKNSPAIAIFPDRLTPSGRLVEVMDVAKLAGAIDIAVGTVSKIQ